MTYPIYRVVKPPGIIRWPALGTSSAPSGPGTHARFIRWDVWTPQGKVIRWDSYGNSGSAPSTIPMGGSGYPATVNWQGKRKPATLAEMPNEHLRQILDRAVAEYYGEIVNADVPKSVKTEAAKLVKPFADKAARYKSVPKPAEVDWAALERDAGAVAAILSLWSAELAAKAALDDDDDFLLMVLH